MKFCEKCDNMYYIRIAESDESKLIIIVNIVDTKTEILIKMEFV